MRSMLPVAVLGGVMLAGGAFAGGPALTPLGVNGTFLLDLSADGSIAVGDVGGQTFRWTADEGLAILGGLGGSPSISADGATIAANAGDDKGAENAATWIADNDWRILGGLVKQSPCDGNLSSAWGTSGDGAVVVGLAWIEGCTAHGFWWSEDTGVVDLGTTVPGRSSRANDIADDASVIIGWQDQSSGFRQGARWVDGTQSLFALEGGTPCGEAQACTPDGSVIVGGSAGRDAWRWTDAGGVEPIGNLPGVNFRSTAAAVTDDGATVVGFSGFGGDRDAFIWNTDMGMVKLDDYVTDLGLDVSGWDLLTATAISGDGDVIAGFGFGPNGLEGWIITLAPACVGDFDDSGDVGFGDLLALLTAWGPCPDCPEDLNGDDEVGFDDLLALLTNWGACD